MGEDYRNCDSCRETGDPRRDHNKHREPCAPFDLCDDPCDPCDPCDHDNNEWDWGSWLPILIIVFILCGGLGWFTGGNHHDDCDNNGSGSWLLILLIIFLVWQGQNDGKKGGFLGGLF